MAKAAANYVCQSCGASYPRWSGRCEACGEWNTIVEEAAREAAPKGLTGKGGRKLEFVDLTAATADEAERRVTGIAEFDRVTGGGLVRGSALFDSLSVWENVAFGLIQGRGMDRVEARDIALRKLGAVGLGPEVGALWPAELSGGMQKRVSLARAIAANPEIIFFDEPTTGLDPIMADVINELVRKCVNDLGATALSITHDMASARKIGDRIAMIYEGRIIWSGRVADIDRSANDYVDQFIHGRAEGPIKMPVRPL